MEDRRISAKSIAEQLGNSRERVGSIIHEDLVMWKLSMKWIPKCLNADQKRQRCQLSEQLFKFFWWDPNDLLSRLVTMYETWLYHYDPETKQQSLEWQHSSSPRPKKFRWKSFCLDFLGSRQHPPHWLSSKGPVSTRSITHLCWCNWKTFWRKNAAGRSPRGSCSCTTMPRLTGHLHPEETGQPGLLMSWSPTLFSGSGPIRLPPVPWTEKNNWKVAIFRPMWRSLLPRGPGWTDKLLNFFWVACRS